MFFKHRQQPCNLVNVAELRREQNLPNPLNKDYMVMQLSFVLSSCFSFKMLPYEFFGWLDVCLEIVFSVLFVLVSYPI